MPTSNNINHKLLLALCLATLCLAAEPYRLTAECNMPRGGDCPEVELTGTPAVGRAGDGVLWDFSHLARGETYIMRQSGRGDSCLTRVEQHEQSRLALQPDGWRLQEARSLGRWLAYELPERHMRLPLALGDTLAGLFYAEGVADGSRFLRQQGESRIDALARGRLITPDGDSLRHVLMVRRLRLGTIELGGDFERSLTSTGDSATLAPDSIRQRLATDSITHLMEVCSWWARGYRYPVFERTRLVAFYNGMPADSVMVTCYISPYSQAHGLASDSINEALRAADALEPFDSSPTQNVGSPVGVIDGMGVLSGHRNSCEVSPTMVDEFIHIVYHAEQESDIDVAICTLAGSVVLCDSLPRQIGYGTHDIGAASLSFGEYIVVVTIGGEAFAHKIIKR